MKISPILGDKNRRFKLPFWLLLVVLMGGLYVSCEKNAFDFSRFEGADAASNWGAKLADATFSIGDIVGRLENNSFLEIGDNDILNLVYKAEFNDIIKASDYLNFASVHKTGTYIEDFSEMNRRRDNLITSYTVPINLSNPYVSVIQGIVENAVVHVTISHNLPDGGDVVLTSENIFNSDGTQYSKSVHLTEGVVETTLDLSGCIIRPTSNHMDITANIVFPRPETDVDQAVINYEYTINSFEMLEADLMQVSSVIIPYTKNFGIHIQNGSFSGDFIVYDPQIRVQIKNSFDKEATCRLEHAQFTGSNLPTVDLVPSVVELQVPNSPYVYQESEMSTIENIHFYADYSNLNISGKMIIEPTNDVIHVDKNASISLKVFTEIPLRINLNDIAYRDTISMNAIALPSLEKVENLTFRVLFENDLPIDMDMQIYFCDANHNITDSLFTNPYILQAAYGNTPVPCEPVYVQKTNFEEIQRLMYSDHMIIYAKLNTQGKVDVDVNRYLRTQIAAKWNVVL